MKLHTSLALLLSLGLAQAETLLKPSDLVAICGDSITEQRQYSVFLQEYLTVCQPQPDLSAIQIGWSGEKAGGFAKRISNDVLVFKPTVATLCYGMNDGGYTPINDEIAKTYRDAMTDAVSQLKKGGVRTIVVGSPGVVDPASYKNAKSTPDEYNANLKALGAIAKEVAAAAGVDFADINTTMMEGMTAAKAKYGDQYKIANDGVHPAANGQFLMAYAFLKGLRCDGEIGTIKWDAASGKAEADPAQKVLKSDKGSIELESTKYPYYLFGNPEEMNSTLGMAQFTEFNQELNRYMLVVANAPKKARLTWGEESKEFTGEELSKGINLAAEFPRNPFGPAFKKVSDAIKAQQNSEVKNIKGNLHALMNFRSEFPEDAAAIDQLQARILTKTATLRQDVKKALEPVTHTLKLQAVE